MPRVPDIVGCALDDRYELAELLGEGAFGRVYRARDRRLDRAVAVKVIKPWWADDIAGVERFQREAQMLARVNDPGVVQIFDIGDAEEGPYYVAELVEGESLADRLRRGPLPVAAARDIAEQLCRALASAHREGVVHCDVKPANVLLRAGGAVKVGDFGVARLARGTSQLPSATVGGTPLYMSPEQARGRPATAATDVYSVGVVLYEMLAGKPPFAEGSAVEIGLRHLEDPPPPLPRQVPSGLRTVVERALAKDPDKRYPDGGSMAAALHDAGPPRAAAPAAARREEVQPATPGAPRRRLPRGQAAPDEAGDAAVMPDETVDLAASRGRDRSSARTRVLPGAPVPPPPRAPGRGFGEPPRRRLFAALAALLVLAVAAIGAVWLVGGAARTTVPELRKLPRGGVAARARRYHVQPVFSKRYSSVAAGLSIAQSPAPHARVARGSSVRVVLSAGPPPVSVPGVVGQSAAAAEGLIADASLRYRVTTVAAPGSPPSVVVRQSPGPPASAPRGSTVALSVSELPRWRPLTTFSGVDDGRSVVFSVVGRRWRVSYSMAFQGTCLLLFFCGGPNAEAQDVNTGSAIGSFGLAEGESNTHVFNSGPGLYRMAISGGRDSARWSMTVQDYY